VIRPASYPDLSDIERDLNLRWSIAQNLIDKYGIIRGCGCANCFSKNRGILLEHTKQPHQNRPGYQ